MSVELDRTLSSRRADSNFCSVKGVITAFVHSAVEQYPSIRPRTWQ